MFWNVPQTNLRACSHLGGGEGFAYNFGKNIPLNYCFIFIQCLTRTPPPLPVKKSLKSISVNRSIVPDSATEIVVLRQYSGNIRLRDNSKCSYLESLADILEMHKQQGVYFPR